MPSEASRFGGSHWYKTKQNKQTNYLASWIDYQNHEENKVDRVRRRGKGYTHQSIWNYCFFMIYYNIVFWGVKLFRFYLAIFMIVFHTWTLYIYINCFNI
jgi:hypothetical protein